MAGRPSGRWWSSGNPRLLRASIKMFVLSLVRRNIRRKLMSTTLNWMWICIIVCVLYTCAFSSGKFARDRAVREQEVLGSAHLVRHSHFWWLFGYDDSTYGNTGGRFLEVFFSNVSHLLLLHSSFVFERSRIRISVRRLIILCCFMVFLSSSCQMIG